MMENFHKLRTVEQTRKQNEKAMKRIIFYWLIADRSTLRQTRWSNMIPNLFSNLMTSIRALTRLPKRWREFLGLFALCVDKSPDYMYSDDLILFFSDIRTQRKVMEPM